MGQFKLLQCKILVICLLTQFVTVLMFSQCDYDIDFERAEAVSYNKDYFSLFKVGTFKYNRTATAFNFSTTVLKEFGSDIQAVVQAYRFASNEYRQFPLRFQFNVCESFAKDEFGLRNMLKYGTFDGCPFKKMHYDIYNWIPNKSKFPPHMPNGRYMVEIQFLYFETEVAVSRTYAGIVRPFGKTKYC